MAHIRSILSFPCFKSQLYYIFGGVLFNLFVNLHNYRSELKSKIELDEVERVLPVPAMGQRQGNGSFMPTNGIKDGIKELTERQEVILDLIRQDETITSSILTQKVGISQRTLMRELAALHEKGFLTREGGRKDGRWVILVPND